MITMQTVQDWGKKFQEVSQGFLMTNSFVPASLYAIDKDGIPSHVDVNCEDSEEDLQTINDLMKELADKAEAYIIVMDVNAAEKDKSQDMIDLDLKGDPNSYRALIAIALTKEEISINQLMYTEKEGQFSFFYNNWEKVTALPMGALDKPW